TDLPEDQQFDEATLDKVADEFRKLKAKRAEWIGEYEVGQLFKDAPYGTGKFIRETFGFADFFIQGKSHYYRKASIVRLAKQLKARNVDLARFIELKQSQQRFEAKVGSLMSAKGSGKKRPPFSLPDYLKDIVTERPAPPVAVVEQDIVRLKAEFFKEKLSTYIDIYGSHAMVKFDYPFSNYFDNGLKTKCRRWCDRFNLASYALELLTSKRAEFIPVEEKDMYEL